MEKNIQPQFVVWPIIGGVILLAALVLAGIWLYIMISGKRRYAKRHTAWLAEHAAWMKKRDAAQEEFNAANKGNPRAYWDRWFWENQDGNDEPREPRKPNQAWWEYDTFGAAVIIFGVFLVIGLPANLGVFAPYNAKYYTFDHVQGTITQINGATQPDGKYVTTNWVLKLDGKGFDTRTLFETDDERIQTYKVGDKVDLTCHYGYEPNGLDSAWCEVRSVDGLQRQK